jgi:hypothetical protein
MIGEKQPGWDHGCAHGAAAARIVNDATAAVLVRCWKRCAVAAHGRPSSAGAGVVRGDRRGVSVFR